MQVALNQTSPMGFGSFLERMQGIFEPTPSVFGPTNELWPHTVEYASGRCTYVSPDRYYWGNRIGPSDCSWIVPGTGEQSQ